MGLRHDVGLVEVVEEADHAKVLKAGQVFVDGGVLAGEADVVAHLVGLAYDVKAGDGGTSACWRENRRKNAHHGRFARTVGTEQSEDLTRRHVEGDVVERAQVAIGAHDIQSLDGVFGHCEQFT